MNKKLFVLSSLLLAVVMVVGVYAAFYKSVPVNITVKGPIKLTMNEQAFTLTDIEQGSVVTDTWKIENTKSESVTVEVKFVEEEKTEGLTYTTSGEGIYTVLPAEIKDIPVGLTFTAVSDLGGSLKGKFEVKTVEPTPEPTPEVTA